MRDQVKQTLAGGQTGEPTTPTGVQRMLPTAQTRNNEMTTVDKRMTNLEGHVASTGL